MHRHSTFLTLHSFPPNAPFTNGARRRRDETTRFEFVRSQPGTRTISERREDQFDLRFMFGLLHFEQSRVVGCRIEILRLLPLSISMRQRWRDQETYLYNSDSIPQSPISFISFSQILQPAQLSPFRFERRSDLV